MSFSRWLLGPAAFACLGAAAYWSGRMALADCCARSASVADAARAVRLAPACARYWLRWWDLASEAGAGPPGALDRALAANPRDASGWIRAGLQAEMQGDFAAAERLLLRAAAVDHTYEPRWTLANYYFRRRDQRRFRQWARGALEWSFGDRTALFQLCWTGAAASPETILHEIVPDEPAVVRDYLRFLLRENRLAAAEGAAEILQLRAGPDDRGVLLEFTERMLLETRSDAAVAAWNALCARGLLPYERLDPGRGRFLTNGDSRADPLGVAFDWRAPRINGVSTVRTSAPPAFRISFSGRHPESCDVLLQYVPVLPERRYRLRFRSRASGIGGDSGLRWQAFDAFGGPELTGAGVPLSGDAWTERAVDFTAPARTRVVRLILAYRRAPGTTRIEGAAWLRDLWLEALP